MEFKGRAKNIIQSKDIDSLSNFLKRDNQVIIKYENQRPYVWTEDEIRLLLNDFYGAYKNGSEYYVHTITVTSYGDNKTDPSYIVDGQQRFTTIILLLHYLLKKSGSSQNLKRLVDNKYEELIFKIDGVDFNNINYDNIIDEDDEINFTNSFSVNKAIDIIDDIISNEFDNNIVFSDFFNWVLDSVYLIVIELLDENCERLYFEDVNSKGKRISQADLIKTGLINKISNEINKTKVINYWKEYDKKIDSLNKLGWKPKSSRDGDLKENIFKEIIRLNNKNFKQNKIKEEIIRLLNTDDEIITFIKKSIEYVKVITDYYYSNIEKYRIQTIFFRERKLKSFVFTVMLAKEYNCDVDICLEIFTRLTLFLNTSVKQLFNEKLNNFHQIIRDNGDVITWYNEVVLNQSVDSITRDLYYQPNSNSRIKSALVFMEANFYKRTDNYKKIIEEKNLFKNFNVEHIYPKQSDKDGDKWFNKFGNLTLLNIGKNSSLKDVMVNKPAGYKDIIDSTILSRVLLTNKHDDYISLRVNKKYLDMLTQYEYSEIVNWNEELSLNRRKEVASLFKEMLYVKD